MEMNLTIWLVLLMMMESKAVVSSCLEERVVLDDRACEGPTLSTGAKGWRRGGNAGCALLL